MSDSLRSVTPYELALFSERIERSLAERPLEIEVAEHRERVAALVREVGAASFYQLLAVGATASPEKVHEGYERVARLVHPSHAPHLGLEGREGVLEVLFERATAAYITLSHPGRRRDYDREVGPAGWAEATPPGKSRAEENRDRARAYFNRAVAYAAKEEYHFAIELLRESARIDPQAKYYVLLAELQAKNAHWLRHAADSYVRALELGGPDPKIDEALARVRQRMADAAAGIVTREPEPVAAGNGSKPAVRLPSSPLPALTQSTMIRYEIEADGSAAPDPPDLLDAETGPPAKDS
jgi:tetratricopeptide (TPR) repeat protein